MQTLVGEEKRILVRIRNKQLFYVLGSYFTLAVVLVQAWGNDWIDIIFFGGSVNPWKWGPFGPYFMGIVFLALTIFFIVYYFQVVQPYIKDIKGGKKEVISLTAGVYKTPYFESFYLETEIKNKKLIKINRELYEAVLSCGQAEVSLSPHARFVFSIESAGRVKKFNDSNSVIEE